MADFNNFTLDEHIIIGHLLAVDALCRKLSEVTDYSYEQIKYDVSLYAGITAREMSDDELRESLKRNRVLAQHSFDSLYSDTSSNNN